ncbi:MAG: NAD-dependent epimerase/dehydratase family protein, partial [Rhodospirillaceae bacterium]|nr:NAD-dependent epimerase/dehydratase family protein [Rhodospirillaceae bacterium]
DVIEGQGSLFHASYAGVSLGLMHGAQPDLLVLCHEPTRTHMRGLPHYPIPDLTDCIALNLANAKLTNPDVRMLGVSVNTSALTEDEAERYLAETSSRLSLPCLDVIRGSADGFLDHL